MKFNKPSNDAYNKTIVNWIRGFENVYQYEKVDRLFEESIGLIPALCNDKNGEFISMIVRDDEMANDYKEYIIKNNGGWDSFKKVNENKIQGFLFDINFITFKNSPSPMLIEFQRKKLEWNSDHEIKYGIYEKSDEINQVVLGLNQIIFNEGELVADGRFIFNERLNNISSLTNDKDLSLRSLKRVILLNSSDDFQSKNLLSMSDDEIEKTIDEYGFNFSTNNFEYSIYRGNSVKYQSIIKILA